MPSEPLLVLGVGNLLVGDEGVGVHVIRLLERETWPAHVHLLDGGTGGFHLLGVLTSYRRVILVDATRDGAPPGTVRQFTARLPTEFPAALGAHDIGLKDLISAAAFTGALPEMTVITISVGELKPMTMELSPSVADALAEVTRRVRELAADAGVPPASAR